MEGLHAAPSFLHKGYYVMKVDLMDAFYAVGNSHRCLHLLDKLKLMVLLSSGYRSVTMLF